MGKGKAARRRALFAACLLLAFSLSLWGLVKDIHNTRRYGGVDLRNRVVGARLLKEGLDPYFFKWSEEYPETLLDPMDNPENGVSRVTVPPTVLALHLPLAWLPYSVQRTAWLFAQWLMLLGSIFLFARCAPSRGLAAAAWLAGLLFSATPFWRFHVERGQVYVLYAFLAALSYWLYLRRGRNAAFAAGLALGALAALRPTFIFMAVPLLVFRKWKALAGLACGVIAMALLCLPLTGVSAWRSYAEAMRRHEGDNLGLNQPIGSLYGDREIEGMDNLRSYLDSAPVNTSVQWYFRYRLQMDMTSEPLAAMMAAAVLIIALSMMLFRDRAASVTVMYMLGSLTVLVSEYFLPAVKPSYVNVLWLLPLELAVLEGHAFALLRRWKQMVALLMMAAGIYFNVAVFWYKGDALLAEALVLLAFLWTALCLLQESPRAACRGKVEAPAREAEATRESPLETWRKLREEMEKKSSWSWGLPRAVSARGSGEPSRIVEKRKDPILETWRELRERTGEKKLSWPGEPCVAVAAVKDD